MHIHELEIINFRGLKNIKLEKLKGVVVIAGPNGCGKSSIFEAIRLFKGSYGVYEKSEVEQYANDHALRRAGRIEYSPIFRDKKKSVHINCKFSISIEERDYIVKEIDFFSKLVFMNKHSPKSIDDFLSSHVIPSYFDSHSKIDLPEFVKKIEEELSHDFIHGCLTIVPGGFPDVTPNVLLTALFSLFDDKSIGKIEYISSNRLYARVSAHQINMDMNSVSTQRAINSISGRADKFHNVASNIANSYIRKLVCKDLGLAFGDETFFDESLADLFIKFIPGKKYKGASIDENKNITFDVVTDDGYKHDINELSSGEKEVLFAYVDMYQSGLVNSVIMIDEPEMHLNPRLVQLLPEFYAEKIGQHFKNQLFLVTHSDAILNEAIKTRKYSVFHLVPPMQVEDGGLQSFELTNVADTDKVLYEVVGLSTYKPNHKIVILEGKNSDFDANVIKLLFPDFADQCNLVSAGSKMDVAKMSDAFELLMSGGELRGKIFSISDPDDKLWGDSVVAGDQQHYLWDSYHIENYLLNSDVIFQVVSDLEIANKHRTFNKVEDVLSKLKEIADALVSEFASQQTHSWIYLGIKNGIKLKPGNNSTNLIDGLAGSAHLSCETISKFPEQDFTMEKIQEYYSKKVNFFRGALCSDQWLKVIPGRRILKGFCGFLSLDYDEFRNLVLAEMKRKGMRPEGIQDVINKILR